MKYISPFNARYGISPLSSGSFSSMEQEFENLFGSLPSFFDVGGECFADSDQRSLNPVWYEHDDAYVVQLELPGVEPKDVTLEVGDDVLSLSAERTTRSNQDASEDDLSYRHSLPIPEGVDADQVTAEYKDGVLSVSLPKIAAVKPRRIDVN